MMNDLQQGFKRPQPPGGRYVPGDVSVWCYDKKGSPPGHIVLVVNADEHSFSYVVWSKESGSTTFHDVVSDSIDLWFRDDSSQTSVWAER